ncbi:MAG: hypothetical protein ABWZ25_15535 [Chitinophagaceae bacterium]
MSDQRETIDPGKSFYPLIVELFEKKQMAGILYEDHGVTRANGMITAVYEKDGEYWFTLNDELQIRVNSLDAVNGTFKSDYTEC